VELSDFPGGDLVAKGVNDLASEQESAEALLVAIGATRLRRAGVEVPAGADMIQSPEHRLYGPLEGRDEAAAHGRCNALVRRLVSSGQATEHAAPRRSGAKQGFSS
jgi:hypothetical protein